MSCLSNTIIWDKLTIFIIFGEQFEINVQQILWKIVSTTSAGWLRLNLTTYVFK